MASSLWGAKDGRVFEMRTYFANEGKLDALHARFRDHTLALFETHGMTHIGSWVPLDNGENKLVYVLAFPNLEARMASWKAFGQDPLWQSVKAASEGDGKLVARVEKQFLSLTDYSPRVKSVAAVPERVFELRTYTASEGNLENLDTLFRDSILELFSRQGMEHVAYWHLMDDQEGAETALLYLLAHESQEAREAAFEAFRVDPDWVEARANSMEQAGGSLLKKKGLKSELLSPTDYSPMR